MRKLQEWWSTGLSKQVKFVFFVLLANAVPAITILMSLPNHTEELFVWTVKPAINARLLGVMYANALLLIGFGLMQKSWARVRVVLVVITLFSIFATLLTFFYLEPFLAHPWFHLTYWLSMYFVLFFAAPYVFVTHERRYGGSLPVHIPLNWVAQGMAFVMMFVSFFCGLLLLFQIEIVNRALPWTLPPLVGGLIGVLFVTHTAAYAWVLWDGDWLRGRPMFWQAPVTGLLFMLLPAIHSADLRPDQGLALSVYWACAGFFVLANTGIILYYRTIEKRFAGHV